MDRGVLEGEHPAARVLDDDHLLGAEQLLADDQRADRVVGGEAAGVADDVRVAASAGRGRPRPSGGRPCRPGRRAGGPGGSGSAGSIELGRVARVLGERAGVFGCRRLGRRGGLDGHRGLRREVSASDGGRRGLRTRSTSTRWVCLAAGSARAQGESETRRGHARQRLKGDDHRAHDRRCPRPLSTVAECAMIKPIRLRSALVGCGKVGLTHAAALRGPRHLGVRRGLRPDPCGRTRLRRAIRGPRLRRPRGDAARGTESRCLSVCTPHPAHADGVEAAAAHGVHVLVEKPLAATLADCDRAIDASPPPASGSASSASAASTRRWPG